MKHLFRGKAFARRQFGLVFTRRASIKVDGKEYATDEWTNLPKSISELVGRNLYLNPKHPIGIVRRIIEKRLANMGYTTFNNFHPVVSKELNFDSLGFPEDHPGRSKSDTYYLNKNTLLRTHTSAHEIECLKSTKSPGCLMTSDVYRRDTIDKTHYPAFHQMEGMRFWNRDITTDTIAAIRAEFEALPKPSIEVEDLNPPFCDCNPKGDYMSDIECELIGAHLKRTLEIIMGDLFTKARHAALKAGSTDMDLHRPLKARWIEATFPWTSPSWEIEIWWKGEWLEMCGCGIVHHNVFRASGLPNSVGWAFGIGLERAAMILFGIPDIRLFWSHDPRFLEQFNVDEVTLFCPWSKYPSTYRDVAFWCPNGSEVHENDVMEIIRKHGGDLIENVSCIDEFVNPKTGLKSQCYRINYQSMERSLTNDEVNRIQAGITRALANSLKVTIR